jgi:molybdopterin-containing oxidoreductase family iron-sulfur binding subunit
MPEFHRRDFLKLVGASAGAAAASGCGDHVTKLIPYVVQPDEIVPGIANYYASTCQACPAACGLHVKTREGRPIKLEGNPDHPVNKGALCALGQASIGWTYHPDRYKAPRKRNPDGTYSDVSWDEAIALLSGEIKKAGGRTWLLGGETGPTAGRWIDAWVTAVGAGGRVVYEPFAPEALRDAVTAVFGAPGEPVFDLSGSDFVIDFGSDFLESGPSTTEHARQLAAARDVSKPGAHAARFVYVGPRLSMTASNADEWIGARPGSEALVALALVKVALGANAGPLAGLVGDVDLAAVAQQADVPVATLERVGKALGAAKAPVLIPPGVALASRRAASTARTVLLANVALGALGKTLRIAPPREGKRSSYRETLALVDAMKGGSVGVLIVHGSNPLYSLPPASGFADALAKVPFVVSLASIADETSERANLILPDHAPLESWGDAEPRAGIRGVVQPTLRPLYDTRAAVDTLLDVARAMGPDVAAQLPEGSFRSLVEQSFAGTDWHATLQNGGVFQEAAPLAVAVAAPAVEVAEPALDGDGEFTLVAASGALFNDGRGANLPWLQETPDPVTKVMWQSFAEISPRAAEKLGGLEFGDVIGVATSAGSVELPVVVRSGVRDDVIAISIGQGHTVGHWASLADGGRPGEKRGVNVIELLPALTDEAGGRAWLLAKARVASAGRHERLPIAQFSQDQRGRRLGLAVTLAELAGGAPAAHGATEAALPAVAAEAGHGESAGHGAEGGHGGEHGHLRDFDAAMDRVPGGAYRWGMSIDMDKCTGCSACVVACYIENNIGIVGEEEVRRGRHMAWLRIERWVGDGSLEGGEDRVPIIPDESGTTVDIRHTAMLCQHCGAAPCEPVCPVIATYHNDDGLNGMIYNRCIGTRYCANNCPYKVRKYNWYDLALTRWPEPMRLMANPDVTVRGQGVMEKCTFCVQRIATARQVAKDENRSIADGEVTTACAQSCPTSAITFGNLVDANSAVAKAGSDPVRGYHSLHELNTRPAVTYLAKVKRGSIEG